MKREQWKSTLGFVAAAAGSAVGLVNIWRFPYVVGQHGGAAFIAIYILFLILIGFPVLFSEVLIGRSARQGPVTAFTNLSIERVPIWKGVGKGIAFTGFLVSSFYSVVAGWIVGYFILALRGGLAGATTGQAAQSLFESKIGSVVWCLGHHALFMGLAFFVLLGGVRRGIELVNRICMPLLVLLLLGLAGWGLILPGGGGKASLDFLIRPDWSLLTPLAILTALGHAFFTLSLGQGTMITYGSYLKGKENLIRICAPIVLFDTIVSLLAVVAVTSLVLAGGGRLDAGPGLIFFTLPAALLNIPGGQIVAVAFFLLVTLAAVTSQISAMEPLINHFVNDRKWSRNQAVLACAGSSFLLGVPSALSFNVLHHVTFRGHTFFDLISFITTDIFIPIGGLAAVLFVGWRWGFSKAIPHLEESAMTGTRWSGLVKAYLGLCVRFTAPVLIIVVLLANLGLL